MKKITITLFALICFIANGQSYTEKDISIGQLKGTLSVPNEKTDVAVLIVAGSGPTDRDGNSAMGFQNNSLKMVAQGIAEAGYAVLRFDKRGISESKEAVSNPADIRFENFVEDTKSWL
ncbi:MAG: alpha/beta hydrolase, partial [Bacteroidota bacterium]